MNRTEDPAAGKRSSDRPSDRSGDRSKEAFFAAIKAKQLGALWANPPDARQAPPFLPFLWRGSDIDRLMSWAAEIVKPGPEAERRVLSLTNPAGGTVHAAVQLVLPGEVAPSHRHTLAAIRFILKGKGAATITNGEPCLMNPGDLILTPGWSWHGHLNEGDGPMMWMDGLDGGILRALRATAFEEYPEGGLQPASKAPGDSFNRYGAAHLRPLWGRESPNVSPLLSFPWSQTEAALHNLAKVDASPFDDVAMEYTNPVTGGHVLPTIGCNIQLLRPGVHTSAHRHSNCAIYHVFRGRGATVIDGVQYSWGAGDFLLLPPMAWHEHVNGSADEEAILFSITDGPVFDALNLYREHPYTEHAGHQAVTGHAAEAA